VVVAKPGTAGVERDDECVGVLEVEQDPFRSGCAGEEVGQLTIDPVQYRGTQQQALYLRRLPVEHLGQQILRDRPIAAGELGHEPVRPGVPGQGQRGQSQSGRPPLGSLVQGGD
jgi:hypothetical protein